MAYGKLETYCLKVIGTAELQKELRRLHKAGEYSVLYYNLLTGELTCDVYDEFEEEPGEPWCKVGVITPFQVGVTSKELCEMVYERVMGKPPQEVEGWLQYDFDKRTYATRWK